jgi:hypothetical protein
MWKEKHLNLSFPEKVESWCIRCKGNGKHCAGDGVWVDLRRAPLDIRRLTALMYRTLNTVPTL